MSYLQEFIIPCGSGHVIQRDDTFDGFLEGPPSGIEVHCSWFQRHDDTAQTITIIAPLL